MKKLGGAQVEGRRLNNSLRATLIVFSVSLLLGVSRPAQAVILSLDDDNASVDIDLSSQHGLFDWYTDGVNIAPVVGAVGGDDDYRQWFWYSVGSAAPASVDTLTLALSGTTDTDFNGFADTGFVRYFGTGFKLEVTFNLVGGSLGSGVSDIGEQIHITNTNSVGNLVFHFYQYGDFQLAPPLIGGENISFLNSNTVHETGAFGAVQETVLTPPATHREVELFPITINKLNNGTNAVTLADNTTLGPGDVTWTYQWDVTIAPGSTLLISKDMQVVIPEPGTFALVFVGIAGLCVLRRRRA